MEQVRIKNDELKKTMKTNMEFRQDEEEYTHHEIYG